VTTEELEVRVGGIESRLARLEAGTAGPRSDPLALLRPPGGVNMRVLKLMPYADRVRQWLAEGKSQKEILWSLQAMGVDAKHSSLSRLCLRILPRRGE